MKNQKNILRDKPGWRKLFFMLAALLLSLPVIGQHADLLNYSKSINKATLNDKASLYLDRLENDPLVSTIQLLDINPSVVMNSLSSYATLVLNGPSGTRSLITPYLVESHETGLQSIYGTSPNGDIYSFVVKGQMLHGEFYDAGESFVLYPLSKGVHALVSYHVTDDVLSCDVSGDQLDMNEYEGPSHDLDDPSLFNSGTWMDDDNCHARLLIALSDDAFALLTTDLDVWCQGRINSCNAAFDASDADMHFELGKATVVNMTENPNYHATVTNKANDLVLFRNGTAPFGNIPIWRNNYRTDIQILMVSVNINRPTSGAIYGQAMAVGADDDDAYAICSMPGITTGRFSFPHEIAHLQGAKHDNDSSSPSWARAHSTGGSAGIRTIMALGCSSTTQGCRERRYSNPDEDYYGTSTATGTSTRDNARRIDDTEEDVRNWRENWGTVNVIAETIFNNNISNYSANNAITTSGAVVTNSGGILTMRAGTSVGLTNGFEVKNGGEFGVYLQNCSSSVSRPGEDEPITSADDSAEDGALSELLNGDQLAKKEAISKPVINISPNPFGNSFELQLNLPEDGELSILVTDISGRTVELIERAQQHAAGPHTYRIDGNELPPGIYNCSVLLRLPEQEQILLSTTKIVKR